MRFQLVKDNITGSLKNIKNFWGNEDWKQMFPFLFTNINERKKIPMKKNKVIAKEVIIYSDEELKLMGLMIWIEHAMTKMDDRNLELQLYKYLRIRDSYNEIQNKTKRLSYKLTDCRNEIETLWCSLSRPEATGYAKKTSFLKECF